MNTDGRRNNVLSQVCVNGCLMTKFHLIRHRILYVEFDIKISMNRGLNLSAHDYMNNTIIILHVHEMDNKLFWGEGEDAFANWSKRNFPLILITFDPWYFITTDLPMNQEALLNICSLLLVWFLTNVANSVERKKIFIMCEAQVLWQFGQCVEVFSFRWICLLFAAELLSHCIPDCCAPFVSA